MKKPLIKNGSRKPRKERPKSKDIVPGYDSIWEYVLHSGLLSDWSFHTETISYEIPHTYHPDFIKEIKSKKILLESKGRFWDFQEYSKYVWIAKALPENYELVFLFANPSAPMPGSKRRKDGTKRSHGEWATSNGFRWFSEETIPDSWVDVKYKEEVL